MYRIIYQGFKGEHARARFPKVRMALDCLREEVARLRAMGGPHAAPWRCVPVHQAFPGLPLEEADTIFEVYEHVSWSPAHPERAFVKLVPDDDSGPQP